MKNNLLEIIRCSKDLCNHGEALLSGVLLEGHLKEGKFPRYSVSFKTTGAKEVEYYSHLEAAVARAASLAFGSELFTSEMRAEYYIAPPNVEITEDIFYSCKTVGEVLEKLECCPMVGSEIEYLMTRSKYRVGMADALLKLDPVNGFAFILSGEYEWCPSTKSFKKFNGEE